MSISFGLGSSLITSLSSSQKLTPQMQQAIKLLQLSSIELEQEVQMKLDSNPLLERVEDDQINADDFVNLEMLSRHESDADFINDNHNDDNDGFDNSHNDALSEDIDVGYDFNENGNQYNNSDNELAKITGVANDNEVASSVDELQHAGIEDTLEIKDVGKSMAEDSLGDYDIDTSWDDIYTPAPTGVSRYNHENIDDYQGATSANLQDHIRWQLNFKHLSAEDVLIANYLIDAMDDSGFIRIEVEELKRNFDTMSSFYQWDISLGYEQIEMMFHTIQTCEPLGVGARSLAECLQIQLKNLPDETPYRDLATRLLDKHDYLVSNNINALIKETGIKRNEINDCLSLIRTLNPSPGSTFINSQPNYGPSIDNYDVPDVLVEMVQKSDNDTPIWKVSLNPDTLPKLKINQEYANLVKRGDDSPDNVYLRDNLTDARLFIRSIEERNHNLLKVATHIVERQQDFLLKGPTAMKPMILKDIAEAVDLHESTVSRLTTSKSILTPKGLFSLKYFFSSHVSGNDGDVSSTAICAMIQELINNENPKRPLSDRAIQENLEKNGIGIARRTVSKYRESMNIGSSTQRKVKF